MRENIYYIGATISSALSFIQDLIPILQIIMLSISLILTIGGIFTTIVDKKKNNQKINISDIKEGINDAKSITQGINNKLKEMRGEKDERGTKED